MESLDPEFSETEKVIVNFELWDKCRQSTVEMPFIEQSYTERFLYEETFSRFATGINSLGCGPIEHELVGLPAETFAVFDPNVSGTLDICTKASTHDELGIYDYVIRGCLTFPVDGFQICATTNDLQLEIKDPCANTIPDKQSLKLLSAPRLKTDGDFINWPFTDSVDASTLNYGFDKCGPKILKIFDSSNDMPVPYLWFDEAMGAIKLEPDLNTPLGIREYYYEVRMVDYPGVLSTQIFEAEVTICEVDKINSNGAYINDR